MVTRNTRKPPEVAFTSQPYIYVGIPDPISTYFHSAYYQLSQAFPFHSARDYKLKVYKPLEERTIHLYYGFILATICC